MPSQPVSKGAPPNAPCAANQTSAAPAIVLRAAKSQSARLGVSAQLLPCEKAAASMPGQAKKYDNATRNKAREAFGVRRIPALSLPLPIGNLAPVKSAGMRRTPNASRSSLQARRQVSHLQPKKIASAITH